MPNDLHKLAIAIAQKSPCVKRKVGAIIVNKQNEVLSTGFNYWPDGSQEFDDDGNTHPDVIHAEVAACKGLKKGMKPYKIICTHDPCGTCRTSILAAGIKEIEIASSFMKWSSDKIMYDLVPVVALKFLAKVFTYGAKKYKPRNYIGCDDLTEFRSALMRHFEAYRDGKVLDEESGLPHLAHLMCNAAIIMDIENEQQNTDQGELV